VPAPVALLVFMGLQDRYFARWLLPVYPLLCLLSAWAAVEAASRVRARSAWPVAATAVLLCAQGLVFSVHNDVVLARTDTWAQARAWMVAHIPEGTRVVIEPIAPDQWAMDAGHASRATGTGNRWTKWPTSRFHGRVVELEDYERTLRTSLLDRYARAGYCDVVTGSTQRGRALKEPGEVPEAIAYYRELSRRADVVYRVSPTGAGKPAGDFSFDYSFNAYPLGYQRAGPEIAIYKLRGC
jgi:hypothetical protein